jgi:hypothetical protein
MMSLSLLLPVMAVLGLAIRAGLRTRPSVARVRARRQDRR